MVYNHKYRYSYEVTHFILENGGYTYLLDKVKRGYSVAGLSLEIDCSYNVLVKSLKYLGFPWGECKKYYLG